MKENHSFSNPYFATRNSVSYHEEQALHCLKISGEAALDALDAVCPCDVFLHDGQIKQTLLLSDEGIPIADIFIGREREDFYILGYGLSSNELTEWIYKHITFKENLSILDLMKTHRCITFDGPFAWELCSEVLGSDVLGLPYLGMLLKEEKIVFRAGNTGEYGYYVLIPNNEYASFLNNVMIVGKDFDLSKSNEEVKAQCALENFFFDINQEGQYGLSVMELQLQWRISRLKSAYPGAKAISKIRQSGWTRRLTCFISNELVNINEAISCFEKTIGKVVAVGYSPLRGDYVGKAIINSPYWHSGMDNYYAGKIKIQTISAPSISNKSLKISPYKDSYLTKKQNVDE